MTAAEADQLITRLSNGESFATRFQEQEWGLEALSDGSFREWRYDASAEPPDDRSEDVLTEAQLRAKLMRDYSFEVMAARFRPA